MWVRKHRVSDGEEVSESKKEGRGWKWKFWDGGDVWGGRKG